MMSRSSWLLKTGDKHDAELFMHYWQNRAQQRGIDLALEAIAHHGLTNSLEYHPDGYLIIDDPDWHLSVSHKQNLAVLLLSRCGPVGVDIEFLVPRQYLDIAGLYFQDKERQLLQTSDSIAKDFYRLWTRKEAIAKIAGLSLGQAITTNVTGNEIVLCRSLGRVRLVTWYLKAGDDPDMGQSTMLSVASTALLKGQTISVIRHMNKCHTARSFSLSKSIIPR